ncbi:60S ribosomal protein L35 [Thelohanellus kitauei]|uniref:Large ribosomal subunit protein uL29 n=1 Tax=Thelohanellus kitauei TaxID=669202 RepID=A0A0C2JW88_THEKT|nr:60S ribosomal protein L35 [Thelohanellus kitauei]
MTLPKTHELRKKTKDELLAELKNFKIELGQLKVARISQTGNTKVSRIRAVRKEIARIMTIINQQQKMNMAKFYKNKKFKPLACRPKLTRAARRKLTRHQESKLTLKQWKKKVNFPMRKFALKADA